MFRPWLMQWAKRSTFCFQIKPCSLRLCMCVGELSDVNTNEFITPAKLTKEVVILSFAFRFER